MNSENQQLNIEISDSEVGKLWKMYGERLRGIASKFLGNGRKIEDSQGIANAAFLSLIKQVGADDLEDDRDYEGLWPLAIGIARNKARMAIRSENAQIRGGRIEFTPIDGVQDQAADDPSFFSELEDLIERLDKYTTDTPIVRQIVERRLQGQTSKEIAKELKTSPSSVSRRLAQLRKFLNEC